MNILVVGGTRFMGKHLINALINENHKVTIATRGLSKDSFGDKVERIILDRTKEESIIKALNGKKYDVVYDTISFCSQDTKILLDNLSCDKYIVISTAAVYETDGITTEKDYLPLEKDLVWCDRTQFPYAEIKRQMEAALFQEYSHFNPIAVRFPLVIGKDDYTERLEFYVKHIVNQLPMYSDNFNTPLSFVRSDEAGKFLAFLGDSDYVGSVNGASEDNLSMKEVASYIESKTGLKPVFDENGDKAPYNGLYPYSLDTSVAKGLGYEFTPLNTWINSLIEYFMN